MTYVPMSPVELMSTYLKSAVQEDITNGIDAGLDPVNIKPGMLNIDQQKAGGVSIVEAGKPRVERYVPLEWNRVALRCSGVNYELADRLGNYIRDKCTRKSRILAEQPSNEHTYIIHALDVIAGNTVHVETQKTWDAILYIEMMIGAEPVS